jgi:hypothetical protein
MKKVVTHKNQHGQALIPVLIILSMVLILGASALQLSLGGMLLGSASQEGEEILITTEGAMENGLMQILRNPAYAGESLQVNGFPCTINVSGVSPSVMTVECQSDRAQRRLQAEVSFVDGEMLVENWTEIE